MRILRLNKRIWLIACMLFSSAVPAGERLGYEAEHALEAPMNARYLSLPAVPDNFNNSERRLQTGFNRVSATSFDTSTLMLGLEYFLSDSSAGGGYLFSLFGDFLQFRGKNGPAVFDPAFIKNPPFGIPLNVNVTGVSGHAEHYGVSASRVSAIDETKSWQYGLVFEYFDIGEFAVSFDSIGLDANFSGVVDYAATYISLAPYVSYRQQFPVKQSRLKYSARIIAAWPSPRQAFSARLSYDGFDQSGAGEGKHIPDAFVGLGFSVKHPAQGWQIDVGASLYFLLMEGRIHKGVSSPILLNVTWVL